MRSYQETDFEKMADRVVGQFLSGKAKLADAAAQEAVSSGLNPDQIERLTQSANTMAFLKMMDQRKQQGAGDLMHEFDPIDSRHVIKLVIDQDGVHVEPMNGAGGAPGMGAPPGMGPPPPGNMELPDEMAGMRMNPAEGAPGHEDSPEVEHCEEECHEHLDPPGVQTQMGPEHEEEEEFDASPFGQVGKKKAPPFGKKKGPPVAKKKAKAPVEAREGEDPNDDEAAGVGEPPKEAMARLMRTRKLAAVLEDQYRQASLSFEDTFVELQRRFKIAANAVTFESFEKDAMFERGDEYGAAVLNALRHMRGLEPLAPALLEKTAALADHHVSDDTPELRLFEKLAGIAEAADRLRRGTQHLRVACA